MFIQCCPDTRRNLHGLFLHLRYKTEYERREKGLDHDKEVLKPRFQAGTESI